MISLSQQIRVFSGGFSKSLKIPTSKSYANRLLILGSIFSEKVPIDSLPEATDVTNLIRSLKKIGLIITEEPGSLSILNAFPDCEKPGEEIVLETGDGGTTNRFLIAMLARGQNTYILKPDPLFLKRPIDDFLLKLSSLGVLVEKGSDFIKIKGPIKFVGDHLMVDSSLSSQFASAFALSLSDKKITVLAKNLEASEKYLSLTYHLIEKFKDGLRNFSVPLDFSSLSYPLALAALTGQVRIENYSGMDPYQADSIFLQVLKEIGVEVLEGDDYLIVRKSKNLKSIEMDCSKCLDLVPTLSFLFSYIPGKTVLKNIKALSYKESDRILEIQKLLNLFKIENRFAEDSLEIIGTVNQSPFLEYEAPKDHRLIMTAYLFMRYNSGGIIKNYSSVDKSFPKFFELLN
jgi:3-phosphoshikimate 1-carboxyvinyltransferase